MDPGKKHCVIYIDVKFRINVIFKFSSIWNFSASFDLNEIWLLFMRICVVCSGLLISEEEMLTDFFFGM